MSLKPVQLALVNNFFRLAVARNFQAAEIILTQIRPRLPESEWHRGYLMALNGILLGLQSQDFHLAVSQQYQQYREEFLKHSKDRLLSEYDRGFFAAWADFCRKKGD